MHFHRILELEGTLNSSAMNRDAYSSTRLSETHPVLSFYEVKGKNPSHTDKMAIGDFRRFPGHRRGPCFHLKAMGKGVTIAAVV